MIVLETPIVRKIHVVNKMVMSKIQMIAMMMTQIFIPVHQMNGTTAWIVIVQEMMIMIKTKMAIKPLYGVMTL